MMDGTPPQDPGDNAPPPPPPAAPPPPAEPPPEAPVPSPTSGGVVSDNRNLWIVLSYLGLLALIPLLVEKEDSEVQWHAKHGLVLMGVEFILFVGLSVIGMVIGAMSAGLGCILGLAWPILMLAILVLHVMCIMKGIKGERLIIPGVSEFADKF
jgi:uncharacterized membrane protein